MAKHLSIAFCFYLVSGCSMTGDTSVQDNSSLQSLNNPIPTIATYEDKGVPIQTDTDYDEVVSIINKIIGTPPEGLSFIETTLMINSPDANWIVARYDDGWGASYFIEPSTNQLVQYTPSPIQTIQTMVGEPLSIEELKSIAVGVARNSYAYNQLNRYLEYDEGNKGNNFFFTWTYIRKVGLYNPYRLQIGLRLDGELISYLDTLVAE